MFDPNEKWVLGLALYVGLLALPFGIGGLAVYCIYSNRPGFPLFLSIVGWIIFTVCLVYVILAVIHNYKVRKNDREFCEIRQNEQHPKTKQEAKEWLNELHWNIESSLYQESPNSNGVNAGQNSAKPPKNGCFAGEKQKKEKVTIVFDSNGAKGDPLSFTFEKGTVFSLPVPPFEAPYGTVFGGWILDVDGLPVTRKPGYTYNVEKNVTYKALWREVQPEKPVGQGKEAAETAPKEEPRKLLNSLSVKLSGVTFEGRQSNIRATMVDTPVRVVATTTNPYDPYAVEIYNGTRSLGFIPKGQNRPIHEAILRKRHVFEGYVEKIIGGGYSYSYGIVVRLNEYNR